jgi:hypothetical protein
MRCAASVCVGPAGVKSLTIIRQSCAAYECSGRGRRTGI